ncbi:MAG: AraC family transcriptional regulator [Firmicutes bacterium]|nr:AraC family transcriptional regulator [Bacillota bacterium]
MRFKVDIREQGLVDLKVHFCGTEDCIPQHSYGPAVRDVYVIHYITDGEGVYHVGNNKYHLSKGSGFFTHPDIVTFYQADKNNPWKYYWVGFSGLKADSYIKQAELTMSSPVIHFSDPHFIEMCFSEMIRTHNLNYGRELRLHGWLQILLSQLIEENASELLFQTSEQRNEYYVQKVKDYLVSNYAHVVSMEDISKYMGFNQSYLGAVFKKVTGMTIKQMLIHIRMQKACELLLSGFSISQVSRSVGYNDPFHFSKMFKKNIGISPSQFVIEKHV